ncbi:MAG TPA: metallophosphoesterase family protein [Rhizomicrobium sp.]|jgi:serine/threonine protein phosphatase 1|nr:metallophosphoesterase family protein [Rhizomicrobium sp.]
MQWPKFARSIATALGRRNAPSSLVPRLPDGHLAYAIGDIHGRSDLLRILIAKIAEDAKTRLTPGRRPTVVFIGDYVDRGPDSRGVIDFLLNELPPGWDYRFLKGNHEETLLAFLNDPTIGESWREFGGLQCLTSYGVAVQRNGAAMDWPAMAAAFAAALPPAHFDFLSKLLLRETIGDYVFVHAGVRPGIPLEYQSERDLLWIREEFTAGRRALPQTVVYGHTPNPQVVTGPGRICVDTGAYATGTLTAAGFNGADVWYLST